MNIQIRIRTDIAGHILASASSEGPFQITTHLPEHFGGSELDNASCALCDAPLLADRILKRVD